MTIKEVSEKYNITQDTLRYYERVGMIPPVPRTSGGIRNYGDTDCGWIELVICMRRAGLPIEAMIEYVHLYQEGDETIPAQWQLLSDQKQVLLKQQEKIDDMLHRLEYKIGRYEDAMKTGKLVWDEPSGCDCMRK